MYQLKMQNQLNRIGGLRHMTYRLKKKNVERVADTEESKNYLMSLGYEIVKSSNSEKTDDKAEDDSNIQRASDEAVENNTDTKDGAAETSPKPKRGKAAGKTE